MTYKGSCHCGKIAYEVEGDLKSVLSCNCSLCDKKGSLLWFVPRDKFKLLTPESDAATYTFNKGIIKHRFCRQCGIHPFAYGVDPKGNQMAAINVRCLEGVDLGALPVKEFDGRAL